ncbi:hypothetical protein ABZ468_07315 [Streptomyces sp. NPDC005708]|uniref:hypothetical protein n=1 Tax=unclassified Streptomyces TaxID=2593676 RepID=UPI0033C540DC
MTRHLEYTAASRSSRAPRTAWDGHPAEAQSFAVTCHAPDAPTDSGAGGNPRLAWLPARGPRLERAMLTPVFGVLA